jgi:hypothetical protein
LAHVARRAGVSNGLVSMAFNHLEAVSEPSKAAIAAAIADLSDVRGGWSGELAPHWRRSGFATWLFQPATTRRYPRKDQFAPHPVPILAHRGPGLRYVAATPLGAPTRAGFPS